MSNDLIYFLVGDIIWGLICLFFVIKSIIDKEREDFVTPMMGLIVTPVGVIPLVMLLFVLLLVFLFEVIPNLIFNNK